MSAAATTADPTGSTAVDPTGSSTPQDVGGEGENHEDTPEVEVVDGSKGVWEPGECLAGRARLQWLRYSPRAQQEPHRHILGGDGDVPLR